MVSSILLGVLAVALLCIVGALWLWQRANAMQERVTTQRFVDSRLAATAGGAIHGSGSASRPLGMGRSTRGATESALDSQSHAATMAGALPGAAGSMRTSGAMAGAAANTAPAGGARAGVDARRAAGTHGHMPGKDETGKDGHGPVTWLEQKLAPFVERANRLAHRAGVEDIRRFYSITAVVLAGIVLFTGLETNFVASAVLLVFMLIGLRLWLWHRGTRQQRRIVTQLPEFIDGVVRMITIGNSVPAAFQAAAPAADLPLRNCLERASRMMRAGIELDKALNNLAELYEVEEFMLIASVVRLSVRYGGRADQVLERMAAFMRDREMAQRELFALSAETRLSAWILGLLPLIIGSFIVFSNPSYFITMWMDPTGRHVFYTAIGLQVVGIFLLYRLAKL